MPLYEYRCEDCSRRFTLLVGMVAQSADQKCPRCGGLRLRKLISRFAITRSEGDRLDNLADPSVLGDPEDPRAMASWMRRVGQELGEDLDGDFDQLVEEAVREEEIGSPSMAADDAGAAGAADGASNAVAGSAEL